jgi:cytochrome c biogenesis protein CcdA/glutaredoxin
MPPDSYRSNIVRVPIPVEKIKELPVRNDAARLPIPAEKAVELPIQGDIVQVPIPAEKVMEFSIFSRKDCTHCIALEKFLSSAYGTGSVRPKYYDLEDATNRALFDKFTTEKGISKATPILLVGNSVIEGFQDADTTGRMIAEAVAKMNKSSYFEDVLTNVVTTKGGATCEDGENCLIPKSAKAETAAAGGVYVKIPWMGTINLKDYSLLFLAMLLGFVDGFNPCAMWVLVVFLTILAQTGSRKKMLQIAGIFILAEAIMYYAILNVWYKTWDFVQLDRIVTPIIGVVSIGAGIFFLYEFFTNKDGECKVTSMSQKKKLTEKIRNIVNAPMSFGIFLATIGVAFSVNVIEFACSVGIPQAFTKLLEMSSVGFAGKQFYISIYTLFYMVDDFVVFGIALYAFQYLGLTTKYTRYCLIIGGSIMLVLGYFFLFNPAALKMLVA